jgi:hypothetical protein
MYRAGHTQEVQGEPCGAQRPLCIYIIVVQKQQPYYRVEGEVKPQKSPPMNTRHLRGSGSVQCC